MFAKGRRGNLVFSDLIYFPTLSCLVTTSIFPAGILPPIHWFGRRWPGFIPNQPKRYYDAFVKVHFIRGIFTFSLHQTTVLHTKPY